MCIKETVRARERERIIIKKYKGQFKHQFGDVGLKKYIVNDLTATYLKRI